MVSIFVAQALIHKSIQVKGGLDRYRDFIFIDDVVMAWVKALEVTDITLLKLLTLGVVSNQKFQN